MTRLNAELPALSNDVSEAERALRAAIDADQLRLAFQPVVSCRSRRMIGFHEALLRLERNDGSLINAGAFLPEVSDPKLLRALDLHVLSLALETLSQFPAIRLSVNLCACSVGSDEWLDIIHRAHRDNPSITARLIIELTEHMAPPEIARIEEFMAAQRRYGVAFALDDFGAGYTSVRHFKSLPYDIVKIDGAFVSGLMTDAGDRVIFESLAQIARHFEMLVVAECVESPEVAEQARALVADAVQGYLFGKGDPVPNTELREENRIIAAAGAA